MSAGGPLQQPTSDGSLITGVTAATSPVRQMGGYTLIREVGRGAMGEVWLGHDPRLDRKVAIKTMRCEIADDPEYIKRFHREARAVAKLSHPHIVQIYGAGEEEGMVYFVMEWVDGRTLGALVREHGQVPPKEALRIMKQASEALGYAAAQGVIHRDIKPGNIMLDATGAVKIADFGLAKVADGQTCMTQTGVCLGSPNYMSPEACRGEELDHRSDQYSLGVTFFEMLKGELPYSAPTPMSVMFKHVHDPLPEPAALRTMDNGIWMDVLRRMTAKDATHRFQSYGELREALAQVESASNGSLNSLTPMPPTPTAQYAGALSPTPTGLPAMGTSMLSPAGPTFQSSVLATGYSGIMQSPAATTSASNSGSSIVTKRNVAVWGVSVLGLAGIILAGFFVYWVIDRLSSIGQPSAVPHAPAVSNTVPGSATGAQPTVASGQATGGMQPPAPAPAPPPEPRSSGNIPAPPTSRAALVPFAFKALSPELLKAYQEKDFAAMAPLVEQFAAKPDLNADYRELLQHILSSVQMLKTYRQDIIAGASQRPAHEAITDSTLGEVWVTGVMPNNAGLTFRNKAGETKSQTWGEISPVAFVYLGREYVSPYDMKDRTDAMMQLYTGLVGVIGPPPGEGGGGGRGGPRQSGPPELNGQGTPPAGAAGARSGGPLPGGVAGQRPGPPQQGGRQPTPAGPTR